MRCMQRISSHSLVFKHVLSWASLSRLLELPYFFFNNNAGALSDGWMSLALYAIDSSRAECLGWVGDVGALCVHTTTHTHRNRRLEKKAGCSWRSWLNGRRIFVVKKFLRTLCQRSHHNLERATCEKAAGLRVCDFL